MSNDNKTLADVQPGGRVRLGDGLPPCPFCGHSDFDQWPCEYIDASGANVVRCAHCHAAAPMKVWHDLSAQPSPGGQGDVLDLDRVLSLADVHAEESREDGVRLLDRGGLLAFAQDVATVLAARQPVGEHGEGDEFLAGVCVALQCVTAQDSGVLWAEIVRAVGVDDLLQYAAFIEPEEWDLAGFSKYASTELHRRKPRGKASKQAKRPPAQAVDLGPTFQDGVADWMGQCFLPSLYSNMTERGDRLLEEVLELLQAHGYDRARVPTLVDYVFGRPVGEPAQEVGGVMVTLAGYCWVAGLDMHAAGDAELARISQPEVMAKIRAKQEAKNALHFDTPLPGNAAAPTAQAVDLAQFRPAVCAMGLYAEDPQDVDEAKRLMDLIDSKAVGK